MRIALITPWTLSNSSIRRHNLSGRYSFSSSWWNALVYGQKEGDEDGVAQGVGLELIPEGTEY